MVRAIIYCGKHHARTSHENHKNLLLHEHGTQLRIDNITERPLDELTCSDGILPTFIKWHKLEVTMCQQIFK